MKFTINNVDYIMKGCAQYPYPNTTKLVQAKEKSSSGITHVEDFRVKETNFTYSFRDLSEYDYLLLMDFFVNKTIAMLKEFHLTDDLGVTRLVRFTDSELAFSKTSFKLWSGSFSVEEVV